MSAKWYIMDFMTKHQQYFQDMMESYEEDFATFKMIHDQYTLDPEKMQDEFNETGEKILNIIRRYEKLLCSHSEGGKYGKFSSNLSDKFWIQIRTLFPKIDFIGIQQNN